MTDGLAEHMLRTRVADLEAQNARYRRLLDQAGTPAELRHRHRNIMATLRQVIQQSAGSGRSLERYVSQLDDRLAALARIHASIDQHGGIDLHSIVADELLFYGLSEGRRLALSGPAVTLTPAAGQALGLAIHELAVNSVEHGAIGSGAGRLDVDWDVTGSELDRVFHFRWLEPLKLGQPRGKPGFGTRVIEELLPYEISATSSLEFSARTLVCHLAVPFRSLVRT
ncbi:MAG: HWE histidine kinase domain-containing protein [Devosia sp.]